MRKLTHSKFFCCIALVLLVAWPLHAQDPTQIVQTAVNTELAASRNDHSLWRYRDNQREADKISIVVQTSHGTIKRVFEKNGAPLTADEARAEDARIQSFIHDPEKIAKQKRDGASDDKNAAELLNMLPTAFLWRIANENGDSITLTFSPNPDFNPPDMQSRVLSAMAGEMVVDKQQHRIKTINGKLVRDVTFGWGLLGRMKQGGTFRVERRELKPGLWQITETHVNIVGKALLFKNIGQQQDEVQTDFTQVPADTTLEQAAEMSKEKH
ncbi:hypothetical protein [Edaphobacter dinghuensis]|uniref:Outer membrane lipoprotein-sorting protein n=1 Tax=Edaphobacter dinghuensis TaxID=1560005 RepID=A0A917LWG6_9BACT|nr:hypothetical protein [Edaphobacter dinghuensis]GGG63323.1 hypothetical protein GCM10011585_01030 [Edaphobacter dinghuensis]